MDLIFLAYMIWTEWQDERRHRAWMRRAQARLDAL